MSAKFTAGPYRLFETGQKISIHAEYKTGKGRIKSHYLAEIDRQVDMAEFYIEIDHIANAHLLKAAPGLYGALGEALVAITELMDAQALDTKNPLNAVLVGRMRRELSNARGEQNGEQL